MQSIMEGKARWQVVEVTCHTEPAVRKQADGKPSAQPMSVPNPRDSTVCILPLQVILSGISQTYLKMCHLGDSKFKPIGHQN